MSLPTVYRIVVKRVLVPGRATYIDAEYGFTNPTPRDTSLCRRTFALGASSHWGAWLDDPRCDVGDIAMFASARPRRCARLFDEASCEVAS